MGSHGPLPQSRRLQVLKGERKRAGRPMTNPPTAMVAAPPKPDDLGEWGEFMWDLVTPELLRLGLLSRLDLSELEAYCRLYERCKSLSPDDRWWNQTVERMSPLAQNLGCSPGARLSMELPEPTAELERSISVWTREPVRRACHRDVQTSSVATCAASTVSKGPTMVIGRPTCGGA